MTHRLLVGNEGEGPYVSRAEWEQLLAALGTWQAKTPANDAQFFVAAASPDLSAERVGVNSPTIRVDYGVAGQVKWHADQAAFGAGYMMGGFGAEDGADGPPGRDGVIGTNGATGSQGTPGAFLFRDGEDGRDNLIPGPTGATGAAGTNGAWTQLSQIVTSATATTVDFTTISGAYTTLKVLWFAQDTTAGTSLSALRLKVNNDGTAGNYSSSQRAGAEAGVALVNQVASSTKGVQIGFMPNVGNTNIVSTGEVTLTGYASTTFHKELYATCAEEDTTNGLLAVQITTRWRSTSAITRLTFSTDGTAFTDGSTFTLYGIT